MADDDKARVERIGDATLYLGDCLEVLPTLGKVDAVVTDPPYGIEYCHGARRGGRLMGTDGISIVGDDQPFDPTPWLQFESLLWGAEHFKHLLPLGGRWLTWNKRRHGVVRDQGCTEHAWHSVDGVTRALRYVWDGADREGERNVARLHSNQKPIAVMEWCLGFIKSQTILDPFMGSGTTGVACAKLGRRFIGVEIEEKYFDMACQRIEEAYAQGDMFIEPPAPAKQEAML